MSASLNRVYLVGNLTRDPELRRLPTTGTAVSMLRLAVSDSFLRRSDNQRIESVVYLDVEVWDRQAETCSQYLRKGSSVLVEGRIQMDEWTDNKTGEKRSRLKVRGERVQFLTVGPRRDGDASGGGNWQPRPQQQQPSAPAYPAPQAQPAPAPAPYEDALGKPGSDDEDIPF